SLSSAQRLVEEALNAARLRARAFCKSRLALDVDRLTPESQSCLVPAPHLLLLHAHGHEHCSCLLRAGSQP
ncbi:hypothetical protein DNTS_003989, partial [Danionella cerebrum]